MAASDHTILEQASDWLKSGIFPLAPAGGEGRGEGVHPRVHLSDGLTRGAPLSPDGGEGV